MTARIWKYWAWTAPKLKKDSRSMSLSEIVKYRPFAWTDKHATHNYIEHYERWFSPLRDKPIKLLELGIEYGPSLALWDEYFYNNRGIYGLDAILTKEAKDIAAERANVHVVEGRSDEPSTLAQFDDDFDIIIDDVGFGAHLWDVQMATWRGFFPKVKEGGLYIIEDFVPGDELAAAAQPFLDLWPNSELIDGRAYKGRDDNNMIVYRK